LPLHLREAIIWDVGRSGETEKAARKRQLLCTEPEIMILSAHPGQTEGKITVQINHPLIVGGAEQDDHSFTTDFRGGFDGALDRTYDEWISKYLKTRFTFIDDSQRNNRRKKAMWRPCGGLWE